MTFAQAVQSVFINYATLKGRAPRSEYWYWVLFVFIVSMASLIPAVLIAMLIPANDPWAIMPFLIAGGSIWAFLYLLTITVSVRRLHDQSLSGWFFLLFLIPSVGSLIQLIFMLQPSQTGMNKYGLPYGS